MVQHYWSDLDDAAAVAPRRRRVAVVMVDPADLAEPREVAVVRAHLKPVLYGERGQVRVGDDVAPEPTSEPTRQR